MSIADRISRCFEAVGAEEDVEAMHMGLEAVASEGYSKHAQAQANSQRRTVGSVEANIGKRRGKRCIGHKAG